MPITFHSFKSYQNKEKNLFHRITDYHFLKKAPKDK